MTDLEKPFGLWRRFTHYRRLAERQTARSHERQEAPFTSLRPTLLPWLQFTVFQRVSGLNNVGVSAMLRCWWPAEAPEAGTNPPPAIISDRLNKPPDPSDQAKILMVCRSRRPTVSEAHWPFGNVLALLVVGSGGVMSGGVVLGGVFSRGVLSRGRWVVECAAVGGFGNGRAGG